MLSEVGDEAVTKQSHLLVEVSGFGRGGFRHARSFRCAPRHVPRCSAPTFGKASLPVSACFVWTVASHLLACRRTATHSERGRQRTDQALCQRAQRDEHTRRTEALAERRQRRP